MLMKLKWLCVCIAEWLILSVDAGALRNVELRVSGTCAKQSFAVLVKQPEAHTELQPDY